MSDEELRERLAEALVADLRTRGFVGIRAVTDVLLPVVRAYGDQRAAEALREAAEQIAHDRDNCPNAVRRQGYGGALYRLTSLIHSPAEKGQR